MYPIVGRSCVGFIDRTDEGAAFNPSHVSRVRTGEKAIRTLFFIKTDESAALNHLIAKIVVLLLGTVADVDPLGLAKKSYCFNPAEKGLVIGFCPFNPYIVHVVPPIPKFPDNGPIFNNNLLWLQMPWPFANQFFLWKNIIICGRLLCSRQPL
jgi:hypothetical protein